MNRAIFVVWCVLLGGIGPGVDAALAGHEGISALLPGNPLEGSRLFVGKGCLGCHAVHGVGGTSGPDLGQGLLTHPLLEIAGAMWNHSPGMEHVFEEQRITRPQFEAQEMANLLAFLYYVGSLDRLGDERAGARVYRERGCEICHALGGIGGHVGPSLDKYSRYASPLFLTTALWNRGLAMAEKMREMEVPRPTFEATDIPDLLAYIRSAGGGNERVYAEPGRPRRGEALFIERRCAECHAIRGHGGTVGPDLGTTLAGSFMQITGTMWNHGPAMWTEMAERGMEPPTFDVPEMADLVSYLYFLQFIDPPGDPVRGKVVYRERGCETCHGSRKDGKFVAPPLAGLVGRLQTPLDIVTQMWNHAGQMEEQMAQANVVWPILKRRDMVDLVAYLLQGQPPASRRSGPAPGK